MVGAAGHVALPKQRAWLRRGPGHPVWPRLMWRLLLGLCLAAAWKSSPAAVAEVTYVEQKALEPYLEHEIVYLRGSVRQTGAGEQVMEFTDWGTIASKRDVVQVVLRSDDDFELRSLEDCWLPTLGFRPETCCAGVGGDPSCFAGTFSFQRCCEVWAVSNAFLQGNMAEARARISNTIIQLL